ncbi:DMP19 family protein [Undibacterium sp. TC4M20W]|uniref:DMP19 family protein n=1 Tax=Undibacterium sp. TC4M20W TaxID=3413052 RepID=UPI003BF05AD4
MKQAEAHLRDWFKASIKGALPSGTIRCKLDSGFIGYSGSITSGEKDRVKTDIYDLTSDTQEYEGSFSQLMEALWDASRSEPLGPLYHCNIDVLPEGGIQLHYFWEGTPFSSVRELETDSRRSAPSFVYRRRYDAALISQIKDYELDDGLYFFIPARVEAGKPISEPMLEIYATLDWQGDVNNGAMNQYFARAQSDTSGIERAHLYGPTYRGLQRIGHEAGAALYAESIALYAHFHDRVEQARAALGIAALPKTEQTDIMSRYYAINDSIESARRAYIRAHIAGLEQEE